MPKHPKPVTPAITAPAQQITDGKTEGLSPKAVLAFLYPLIAAVLAAVASWISTGNFSDSEIRTALSGVILSGLALLGAAVGRTGKVKRS